MTQEEKQAENKRLAERRKIKEKEKKKEKKERRKGRKEGTSSATASSHVEEAEGEKVSSSPDTEELARQYDNVKNRAETERRTEKGRTD